MWKSCLLHVLKTGLFECSLVADHVIILADSSARVSCTLTLGYCQERDNRDSVPVRATHTISHVPYGKIEWVIFILTCRDGDSSLVAPEDHWNEGCSLCIRPHTF